nr:MAG TPA: hypothetical protein [Caudoviricetes sp.]
MFHQKPSILQYQDYKYIQPGIDHNGNIYHLLQVPEIQVYLSVVYTIFHGASTIIDNKKLR